MSFEWDMRKSRAVGKHLKSSYEIVTNQNLPELMEDFRDRMNAYLPCEGLDGEIEKILMEKQPFEVPVNMPCRVWMESPSVWIADCQVLGLTTFNNSADGAKNALINRIRIDLALRAKGMN